MVLSNKIWATFLGGSCLYFGTCALFGYFPGESIGVVVFAQLAERFGAVETGLGTQLVGLILTIWSLLPSYGLAPCISYCGLPPCFLRLIDLEELQPRAE